jgi:hypothetical protein
MQRHWCGWVRATRLSRALQSTSLLRRGLCLEYPTHAWNVVGTLVILIAAVRTGSAALAGFGLDSAIEIFASVVVVWQIKGLEQDRKSLEPLAARHQRILHVIAGAAIGFRLNEKFRPDVAPGNEGWAARAVLAVDKILAAAP